MATGGHDLLAIGRELMRAVSERDVDALLALSTPDAEWRSFFAGMGAGGVYRGHEGLRTYMRDLDDTFAITRADVDDGIAVGNVAVLVGNLHFRGKDSGVETETAAGWMLRFRDGKIAVFRAFRDPEQALEAMGLGG